MNEIRKPIFICGCHRTGTTLLQTILSQHPNVDILPETKLFGWQWHPFKSIGAADPKEKLAEIATMMPHVNRAWGLLENKERLQKLRASQAPDSFKNVAGLMQHLLAHCTNSSDSNRVGEKSPLHIYHIEALLKQFPDAKILITTRDLRGAFYSQMSRSKRSKLSYRSFNVFNFVAAWTSAMELASLYRQRFGDAIVSIVAFEKLLSSPEQTLKEICEFVELPFEETMLDVSFENSSFEDVQQGVVSTAADRWKTGLPAELKTRLDYLAARQLQKWNYESSEGKPRIIDRIGKLAISFVNFAAKQSPELVCFLGRDPRYKLLSKQYRSNNLPTTIRKPNHHQAIEPSGHSPRVFIFGNHKSGTTAIATLLGELCELPTTIDFPRHCRADSYKLIRGDIGLSEIASKYPALFENQIVKIPALTFVANDVVEHFPNAKIVFIVRDPRDNIRSILNRRKISGNRKRLPFIQNWIWTLRGNPAFDPNLWGNTKDDDGYVGTLAHRWNRAIEILNSIEIQPSIVKYEEFLNNKYQTMTDLAEQLELETPGEIQERLDVQFQPAGNRNVDWLEFFGSENLATIEQICAAQMHQFGYTINSTDR